MFRRAAEVKRRLYGSPKAVNVRQAQINGQRKARESEEIRRELIEGYHREPAIAAAKEVRAMREAIATRAASLAVNPATDFREIEVIRIKAPTPVRVSANDIIAQGCLFFGMSEARLFANSRSWDVVDPRQTVMWATQFFCPHLSLPMIGRRFDRDHTTVMHAVRKIDKRIKAGDAVGIKAAEFANCLRTIFPNAAI
ncbi:helix-turn-helix domain-containing protein [Mesorhizobium sp. Cs1299R1N3]|uniref:helix-turn-helix domain-containing protein n=1 Tax=Mesorhizobium sp. Cs1299R1N3 TaxID=3015173 RepID=UPI00301DF2B1